MIELIENSLVEFGKNVWVIEGSFVKDMGLTFSTRMIVVKLSDGMIWICDPVKISENAQKSIEKIGEIKYLIASTQRHIWRLNSWHKQFPNAELWSCGNIPKKLKKLPYKGILSNTSIWDNDFEQIIFEGNKYLSEMVFYHKVSKTIFMGDIIQNNVKIKGRPFTNFIFWLSGAAYPNGGVGLDLRLTFTDKNRTRKSLDHILSWDFDKLIIAHGPCVTENAKEYVKRAFNWL